MMQASHAIAHVDVSAKSESHPLVTIALFCAVGLLLSLTVIASGNFQVPAWY